MQKIIMHMYHIFNSTRNSNAIVVLYRSISEFVYAVTAAEGIILSSLFIGRKQR